MINHNRRVGLALVSAMLVVCLWFLFSIVSFLFSPVVPDDLSDKGIKYTVAVGASTNSVINELSQLGIVHHPWFFKVLVFLKGNKHDLKAGEYLFQKGTTPNALLKQITTGTGMYFYSFRITPGWNFKHLRDVLLQEPNLQHLSALLSEEEIMKQLGHPELKPEGQFYPDTYYFIKGSSDLAILKRSFQMMQDKLSNAWNSRASELPFKTPTEALTAASLVEKETGLESERPIIAGVIINRLRKNMLLQIDPTVIYAMGERFNGTIYKTDLLSKNPYNTYTNKGLPPTPIAMPSMGSINAVLHPQQHNYFYFVAKSDDRKQGHQFSATLAEHNKAVAAAKQKRSSVIYFNDGLVQVYFNKVSQ